MDEKAQNTGAAAGILSPAEIADLEARRDGSPGPELRRALRHGSGALARQAEALAQSRLFDDLATSAVQRRARLRDAGLKNGALATSGAPSSDLKNDPASDPGEDLAADDLAQYRRQGLISLARCPD